MPLLQPSSPSQAAPAAPGPPLLLPLVVEPEVELLVLEPEVVEPDVEPELLEPEVVEPDVEPELPELEVVEPDVEPELPELDVVEPLELEPEVEVVVEPLAGPPLPPPTGTPAALHQPASQGKRSRALAGEYPQAAVTSSEARSGRARMGLGDCCPMAACRESRTLRCDGRPRRFAARRSTGTAKSTLPLPTPRAPLSLRSRLSRDGTHGIPVS